MSTDKFIVTKIPAHTTLEWWVVSDGPFLAYSTGSNTNVWAYFREEAAALEYVKELNAKHAAAVAAVSAVTAWSVGTLTWVAEGAKVQSSEPKPAEPEAKPIKFREFF